MASASIEYAYLRSRINRLFTCSKTETKYFLLSTLEAAVTALEADTNQVLGHSSEVAVIAGTFAQKIGLSDRDVYIIKISALLHDIGKAFDGDFNSTLKHPNVGAAIIRQLSTQEDIANTVLYHHAHWDGSGHPLSLAGKDIPLASRIISLANTFQIFTAGNYYRHDQTARMALAEIRRRSGTQFDPALARKFIYIWGHASW